MVQWYPSVFYQFAGLDYALFVFFFLMGYSEFEQSGVSKSQGEAPDPTRRWIIPITLTSAHPPTPRDCPMDFQAWRIGGMHPWWQLQFPCVDVQASHSQSWCSGIYLSSISLQNWILPFCDLKNSLLGVLIWVCTTWFFQVPRWVTRLD